MKRFILLATVILACGTVCRAQLKVPSQIDTFIVTGMKYNYVDIDEKNWPYSAIYRSTTSFRFGNDEFPIISAGYTLLGLKYTVRARGNGEKYDLLFDDSGNEIVIQFSGYEFHCRPNLAQPSFQGGGPNQFSEWVAERLHYPESAKKEGIEGMVKTRFTIDEDGFVTDVHVTQSLDPRLDEEAVRVIKSSPRWTPGYRGRTPVAVYYDFPVIFNLKYLD